MQLVLDSNGISLKGRNKTFWVSKQKEGRLISPFKITSIAITADVVLSSAAMKLAVAHGIPIYFFGHTGRGQARLWSLEFGNLATLRRKQAFSGKPPGPPAGPSSSFSSRTCGRCRTSDSAAYLQSWVNALQGDARLLMTAASAAQRAADFLLAPLGTQAESHQPTATEQTEATA